MGVAPRPFPADVPAPLLGEDLRRRVGTVLVRHGRRHVGLAVAIRIGDRTATFGRGVVSDGVPQTPDGRTIFEIGSITKVFTATLLAEMSVAGLVGLDDTVQHHLPRSVRLRPGDGPPPTLAELASHTAGLPRLPPGVLLHGLRERRDPYADFRHTDLWRAVERTRPRRRPDGQPHYSNFGGGLLGELLALRAGTSYAELVSRRVTGPLRMDDTTIEVPEGDRDRLAQGHSWRGRPAAPWHMPALAGAGALRSTASDLLRLLGLHLDGGHTALHRAAALTAVPRAGQGRMAVGLGWQLMPLPGRWRRVLWHNGGTGGFRSFAGVVRESRVGVVVLASTAISVDRLGMRLLELLDAEAPAGYAPERPSGRWQTASRLWPSGSRTNAP